MKIKKAFVEYYKINSQQCRRVIFRSSTSFAILRNNRGCRAHGTRASFPFQNLWLRSLRHSLWISWHLPHVRVRRRTRRGRHLDLVILFCSCLRFFMRLSLSFSYEVVVGECKWITIVRRWEKNVPKRKAKQNYMNIIKSRRGTDFTTCRKYKFYLIYLSVNASV